MVTIYRRESDLFALLLRERRDTTVGSGVAKVGSGKLTVLCDMTLDDAVHLEPQSTPLVVKVVNTCESLSKAASGLLYLVISYFHDAFCGEIE